jgi:hypothetical protein
MHSMQKLQQVAPRMKAIQAKYNDDKQHQQQEIMKFYKENEINPFASFLPVVARFPGLHRPLLSRCDNAAGPKPRRAEHASRPCDQDPAEQGGDQECDKIVVEQASAGEKPDGEPQALIPAAEDRYHEQQDQDPREQVEDCSVQCVTGAEQYR